MKIILKTERLYLREFNLNDSIHLFELNNNPKVIQYTGDDAFKSVAAAADFIENYNEYQKNGFGRWAVCLKTSDEFLGWCGLKFNEGIEEIDLGFRFFEENWHNGYASESAKACTQFGFFKLKLNKIVGRAYIENKASISVLEKCGFTFKKYFTCQQQAAVLYSIENDTN